MSDIKCPYCSAALPRRELDDGWCETCGKSLPTFVYHQAGLKGPKGYALPAGSVATAPLPVPVGLDPEDRIAPWKLVLLGLFVVVIVFFIVRSFV